MYQKLAKYYDIVFPINKAEEDFLSTHIRKSHKTALDLGTGTGTTAFHLESLGLKVSALDISDEMISLARSKYPAINFIIYDILNYLKKSEETYHVITCFGNTLAHLTPVQLSTFFKLVGERLKKRGVLLIQILNYNNILKNRPEQLPKIEKGNVLFERFYQYYNDKILFETKIYLDKKLVHQGDTILYPHLKETFEESLTKYNFSYKIFGQFYPSYWSENSSHLTIVATQDIKKD